MSFVHLHTHSEFSLLDGACRISQLPARAAEMGQTALAITDHGVMFGAVDFYRACRDAGIKPIIGCEVYVAPASRFGREHSTDSRYSHLILLCKNETGYHNLCRLVSAGFTEGFYMKPRIDWELLREYHEGLVCLSGCIAGEVPAKIIGGDYEAGKNRALFLRGIFGDDFYLEIQNHGTAEEMRAINGLIRLHEETGIPLVATNDAHYLEKKDAPVQDVLMCIQMGKTVEEADRLRFEGRDYYLKSEQEMLETFPTLPEAVEITQEIADKCCFDFEFGHYHLPVFPLPQGETDAFSYLRRLCLEGYEKRYPGRTEEMKQLEYELSMIRQMGFTDYFLIVSDFVAYAKRNGIPVGPGRGSAAGSVVSYCLGITDVDPIKYSLYFERFLNPERVSMPDIDIDFCIRRRGEVIDYVSRKYGRDHVAQIVTFGTMAAKNAIRDVGRALGISYADTDACARAIPNALHITIEEALQVSKPLRELYEQSPEVQRLINTARGIEGMPRHSSTHAAGVVITKLPVQEYVPLSKNDDVAVTQYQMTTLEQLGLLKMDFLGLRNLTILDDAVKLVQKSDPGFDIETIPEDDEAVFAMLSAGKTSGVFQLESQGITSVCVSLHPGSIEDITAIIALYRPGPMDSIPRFIECRHDETKISYKHPLLEPILSVTYGCIVYQEQVIEIFRRLAGFSLGQADMIRRAMSKKKEKEIKKERSSFIYGDSERNIPGAVKLGIPEEIAGSIYDEILDFANYAFNKAHAVSYAIVAYRTAYMKCRHPREYMAALITSVLGQSAKIAEYTSECKELGIRILPPDINRSYTDFSMEGNDLRFGMAAIKNVGRGFSNGICTERQESGPFTSFEDFCRRMSRKEMNRRALESLISAGAFDSFQNGRRSLLVCLDRVVESIQADARRNISGQMDLFGLGGEDENSQAETTIDIPKVQEFTRGELLTMERDMTGLYFSGHPLDEWRDYVNSSGAVQIGQITESFAEGGNVRFKEGDRVVLAGIIMNHKVRLTKNRTRMAYITIEDDSGDIEMVAFDKTLQNGAEKLLEDGRPLLAKGRISLRDEVPQITLDAIGPITGFVGQAAQNSIVQQSTAPMQSAASSQETNMGAGNMYLRLRSTDTEKLHRIELISQMFIGPSMLTIYFEDTKKRLGTRCLIHPAFVDEMEQLLGRENVVIK